MSGLTEKIQIANLLEKVVTSDHDFGVITYKPGWSDGRVASEIGTSVQQVVAVRKAIYGSKFATPRTNTAALFESRLKELEKRISKIEQALYGAQKAPQGQFPGVPSLIPRWDLEERA